MSDKSLLKKNDKSWVVFGEGGWSRFSTL